MHHVILGVLIVLITLAAGCAKVPLNPETKMPRLLGAGETNPDVVWMVWPVEVADVDANKRRTLHALFACYRSPTPGAPKCYLAETTWNKGHMTWPVNTVLNNGRLRFHR